MNNNVKIAWIDSGKQPQCNPDPAYPHGKDLDAAGGKLGCTVALPYPAPRVGHYIVECKICGYRAGVTTAGRTDDPKSIRIPCKIEHTA